MNPANLYSLKRVYLDNLGLSNINIYQLENKVLRKIAAKIIEYCPVLRANFTKIIKGLQLDNRPSAQANDLSHQ